MKLWHLPVQLLSIALVVPLALLSSFQLQWLPTGRAAPAADNLWALLPIFLSFHLAMYLISLLIHGHFAFSSLPRLLREICFATIANAFATSYLFVFTTIPFSPTFVANLYLLTPLSHFLAFVLIGPSRPGGGAPSIGLAELPLSLGRLMRTGLAYVTIALALTPALLFYLGKRHEAFGGLLETIRVAANVETPSTWLLEDLDPSLKLAQPIDLRFLREDLLYVLERAGRIKSVARSDGWQAETVLDFSSEAIRLVLEDGALSLALHPEFGDPTSVDQGHVYVYYTHMRDHVKYNRLSRFDLALPTAEDRRASELILIEHEMDKIGFHNGGSILFGPDGFLYLSIGDSSNHQNAQNTTDNLLSGILRIDVDQRGGDISMPIRKRAARATTNHYYIPKDNPFVDEEDVLDEYWALGFRNPFRMAMDEKTDDIWLGDVGLRAHEEVNRVRKGANGQWPYREGPGPGISPKPDVVLGVETPPVYAYEQTLSDRAVIGGVLYRGTKLPTLYGTYLFADNQSGVIRVLDPAQEEPTARVLARVEAHNQWGIAALTESPEGEIVVTVLGSDEEPSGRILRLRGAAETAVAGRADPGAPVAELAATYDQLCVRCHGSDGRGQALEHLDRPPDFTNADWQAGATDAYLREVIVRGGEALGLDEAMPAWEGVVTDRELDELVEKVRSFGTTDGERPPTGERAGDGRSQ